MIAIATAIAIAMTIAIEGLLGGVSWGGPEGLLRALRSRINAQGE